MCLLFLCMPSFATSPYPHFACQVIKVPKARSARWISTSIPQAKWDSELAKHSSAEYHVNNLVSPVLFQEGLQHIPSNAVVIEISAHALLQVPTFRCRIHVQLTL